MLTVRATGVDGKTLAPACAGRGGSTGATGGGPPTVPSTGVPLPGHFAGAGDPLVAGREAPAVAPETAAGAVEDDGPAGRERVAAG